MNIIPVLTVAMTKLNKAINEKINYIHYIVGNSTIIYIKGRETHNLGADIGTYLSGNISEFPRFQKPNNS